MDKRYFKTQPMEHQVEAFNLVKDQDYFALFMDMGTGKTKVTIDDMSFLYLHNKVKFVLVIAPNSNYMTWADEIRTHSSVRTNVFRYKIDKKFIFKDDSLNYYLINTEAFSHQSGIAKVENYVQQMRNSMACVVDESTWIKNRTAKRTKNIIRLTKGVRYKRILSGFPVTKSPLDLFSQCNFLRPGLLGSDNYYAFIASYSLLKPITTMTGRVIQEPYKFVNLDKLLNILRGFSYRTRKSECLDLPPKIFHTRIVPMTPEQKRIYGELKKNARTVLKNKEATYQNRLTEIVKLHQVANGYVMTDDGKRIDLSSNKINELFNIIGETDDKIIIWSTYVYTINKIAEALVNKYGKKSVVTFYGEVSVKDRHKRVEDFQNNKEVRFFVANPSTGGIGLTLTAANTVIYYCNNFNLEQRVQSEDRAHRKGQKNVVNYIDLITENTIDKYILHALKRKLEISAKTLGEDILDFN